MAGSPETEARAKPSGQASFTSELIGARWHRQHKKWRLEFEPKKATFGSEKTERPSSAAEQ